MSQGNASVFLAYVTGTVDQELYTGPAARAFLDENWADIVRWHGCSLIEETSRVVT